jgi:hypothetical protein
MLGLSVAGVADPGGWIEQSVARCQFSIARGAADPPSRNIRTAVGDPTTI